MTRMYIRAGLFPDFSFITVLIDFFRDLGGANND